MFILNTLQSITCHKIYAADIIISYCCNLSILIYPINLNTLFDVFLKTANREPFPYERKIANTAPRRYETRFYLSKVLHNQENKKQDWKLIVKQNKTYMLSITFQNKVRVDIKVRINLSALIFPFYEQRDSLSANMIYSFYMNIKCDIF